MVADILAKNGRGPQGNHCKRPSCGGFKFRCFNCEGQGHKASNCPSPLNMDGGRQKEGFSPEQQRNLNNQNQGGSCGESTTAATQSAINTSKGEGEIITILILSLGLLASLIK